MSKELPVTAEQVTQRRIAEQASEAIADANSVIRRVGYLTSETHRPLIQHPIYGEQTEDPLEVVARLRAIGGM